VTPELAVGANTPVPVGAEDKIEAFVIGTITLIRPPAVEVHNNLKTLNGFLDVDDLSSDVDEMDSPRVVSGHQKKEPPVSTRISDSWATGLAPSGRESVSHLLSRVSDSSRMELDNVEQIRRHLNTR